MVNRLFTLDGAREEYGFPSNLIAALPKNVRSIATADDGTPMFLESQIDIWISEFSGDGNKDNLLADLTANIRRIAERLAPNHLTSSVLHTLLTNSAAQRHGLPNLSVLERYLLTASSKERGTVAFGNSIVQRLIAGSRIAEA